MPPGIGPQMPVAGSLDGSIASSDTPISSSGLPRPYIRAITALHSASFPWRYASATCCSVGSVTSIGEGGFVAADRHKGMYGDKVFPRRPNAFVPPLDKPALNRKIGDLPPLGPETGTAESTIRDRAEMLMAVDESLGKLMDVLQEKDQLDNTIVVFTSDHGYWYGEHGLNEERRLAYEESIRIPLLIRYGRAVKAGTRKDEMVQSIDLAPTLLQWAGTVPGPFINGRSMVTLLNGRVDDWRTSILVEYYSDTVFPRIVNMGYKAVRNERYKYIWYTELPGADELYDLQSDPYELKNLAGDPAAAQTLEKMKAELAALAR